MTETDKSMKGSDEIINRHVGFAMVAGAIPVPVVDIAAVSAIQLDMIRNLAEHYGIDYNAERGKSLVSTLIGSTVGSTLGRGSASVVKVVPGIGTLLGITSQVVFSGASTYALGKVFQRHFTGEGDLFNLDIETVKKSFAQLLAKGKKIVRERKTKPPREDIAQTLTTLKDLMDKGVITEAEFNKTKAEILKKFGA